jgi:NADPH:quinone reductase
MRRAMVNAFGGPEQLIVQRVSDELRPAPGQMLVDVEAAGVNYIDVYQRNGIGLLPLPFIRRDWKASGAYGRLAKESINRHAQPGLERALRSGWIKGRGWPSQNPRGRRHSQACQRG